MVIVWKSRVKFLTDVFVFSRRLEAHLFFFKEYIYNKNKLKKNRAYVLGSGIDDKEGLG